MAIAESARRHPSLQPAYHESSSQSFNTNTSRCGQFASVDNSTPSLPAEMFQNGVGSVSVPTSWSREGLVEDSVRRHPSLHLRSTEVVGLQSHVKTVRANVMLCFTGAHTLTHSCETK